MRKTVIAALLISAGCLAVPAQAGDPYRRGGGAEAKAYNHNDNTAYGGHAKAYGGNSKAYSHSDSTAYGGNAYGGKAYGGTGYGGQGGTAYGGAGGTGYGGAGGHASSDANVENANNASQSVNVEAQQRNPVSTAYAPPLAVGEDTCMGSSSIGGQGVGFGISIGTSWTDENCQRLKNSRQLAALGFRKASVALLCVNDDVARAMAAAGLPCRVQGERGGYELSTASLGEDHAAFAPPPPRVVYSGVVEERRYMEPRRIHPPKRVHKPKRHKPKGVRCRMVRQCTR